MVDGANNPVGGSLEAEEKAMKQGKGRMLAGMITAGVIAVAALVWYMGSGDDEAYSKFGRSVNGLDQEHFDQFWGCALRGADLGEVKSDQDLREQIHRRAENGGARYTAQVRDVCLPKLDDLVPSLTALIPPEDMQAHVSGLVDPVRRLQGGWSDYIAYVDGLEGPYSREGASERMDVIARAWFDYRKTLAELNKGLREKLGR